MCVPEHYWITLRGLQGIGDVRHPGYCENPDREVLIAVFQATNGPTWQERDRIGWLSDLPLDQWQGVTTDQNGRVSAVDLSNGWT